MSSVQFYGRQTAVDAFIKRDCPAWSLWAGRQFLLSNASESCEAAADVLDEYLEMIEQGGTNAAYTIKVYEEKPPGRITDKTPCDGSFNFKFRKPEEGETLRNSSLERRMAGIETMLAGGATKEDQTILGKIGEFIDNNEWAQPLAVQIIGNVLKMLGMDMNIQPALSNQLAGIEGDKQIDAAIAILKTKDARLGEHLTKLAALPAQQLNFLLQALDNM